MMQYAGLAMIQKTEPCVRLWILRILFRLGGHCRFMSSNMFMDDEVARAVGVGRWAEGGDLSFDKDKVLAELRRRHAMAEARSDRMRTPVVLSRNIARLSGMLELSSDEARILEFVVLIHTEYVLDTAADWLGSLSTKKASRALGLILGIPTRRVAQALGAHGTLARSGLVCVDRSGAASLRAKLDMLSGSFADRMLVSSADPVDLLRDTVSACDPPEMALSDYTHISSSIDILVPYLRKAVTTGRRGVNIFVHGPPGTGKTQLARVLAAELGCPLFGVASEDSDGDPIGGEKRLRALRAAQTLFAKRKALILFDEVEDVFNDGHFMMGRKSTAQSHKAWMNRMLEEGSVPTLWMSNSARIDNAFIRRFDMVITASIPPRKKREAIVSRECRGLVGSSCVSRIAESDSVAPALVTRAASVVRIIADELDEDARERALEHLVGSTLEAQGHRRPIRGDASRLPDVYDTRYLNADADLPIIADGLSHAGSGRLCLYGPPGTGKTAYGRWLARELDMELHVKRASDLLSPFVGGTEALLAEAFSDARRDGAIIMIDEVDSFLRDRKEARHSWEATQVNEMLMQMEAFPGIFIASTNLMDGLDPAALRRFDIKIRLDYLLGVQAVELLRSHVANLGLPQPSAEDEAIVCRMGNLAPGDYAAVARQHRFRPIGSPGEFVSLLGAESRLKGEVRRPIGFVH